MQALPLPTSAGHPVTPPPRRHRREMAYILGLVAEICQVEAERILGRRRTMSIADARQISIGLCLEEGHSTHDVALFHERTLSLVQKTRSTYRSKQEVDPRFAALVREVQRRINQGSFTPPPEPPWLCLP